ncbi:NUDIX hydrolase [Paraburkholderia tropica]|uniref:NUDIX hydrolase n=1 Tax=Paraburkholderia tropica TaxID=92647 RepID=UPI002AB1DEC9|nr:NUDIX hydrolase [Paraburkholderia tropica]
MKTRATVICHQAGRVLVVARTPSRWALPGGKPEEGEALEDAARRELVEETTLDELDLAFLFQADGSNTVHHVFGTDVPPLKVPAPGREIALCQWIAADDIASLPTSKTTQAIVAAYLARERTQGSGRSPGDNAGPSGSPEGGG